MHAFETSGYWWLANDEEQTGRVPGTLTVSATGEAELTLIGSMHGLLAGGATDVSGDQTTTTITRSSREQSGVYPRILGETDDGIFTLNDCFQTHRRNNFFHASVGVEKFHVHQVFKGCHFEHDEELQASQLNVSLDWLPYWLQMTGLEESYEGNTAEEDHLSIEKVTISMAWLDVEKLAAADGAEIKIAQTFKTSGDFITGRSFAQDFAFVISPATIAPLPKLLDHAQDLQSLVSMGTGRTAAFSAVHLRHPDVFRRNPNSAAKTLLLVDIFANWTIQNDRPVETLNEFELVFSYDDIGRGDGVARWLAAVAPFRSSLSRVMSTRYSRKMFTSDRLLNCAAALEAYDREKYGDDIYYVDQLKRTARYAGPVFESLVGNIDRWAKKFKTARNDVAHQNTTLDDGSALHYFLAESGYWLFVLCLLRDSQAPDRVYHRIDEHRSYAHLRMQISSAVEQE